MSMIHATCVAIDGAGVLLRGPSGSGKSDLALRLIDGGAQLVADDQVVLERLGDGLWASAPPTIRGRMEVRGIGIVDLPCLDAVPVGLIVDLVAGDSVERLPEAAVEDLDGVRVPRLSLAALEASAPAKVRLAVRAACGNSMAPS